MYAAHAEKKRQEASQLELQKCLSLLDKAVSDNDKFSAVLEITRHIRFNTFTNNDRERIVHAMGFDFLSKLITMTYLPEECPSNLYKSIALSMLSTICIEPSVVSQSQMKVFVKEINDMLLKSKQLDRDRKLSQMKTDCLDILYHVAHHPNGAQLLLAHNSIDFLLKFIQESYLKDTEITKALTIVGLIMKKEGDRFFHQRPGNLTAMMDVVSQRLAVGSDVREKIDFATAITLILDSISMVSIDINSPWVQSLASSVTKLLIVKLAPDDSEVLFYLFTALISLVGCEILNMEGQNSVTHVKALVARVSVEVYMLLDGIGPSNASARFPKLNKVYRLLSDLVQYVCGDFGESADTDTIISLYRKLVDISNTVMEFLYSIANHDVELPRNHGVVLISVRVLAAMLSEITEDPSPTLLKLLPFFNLLCQNVEYSDDVKLEVKNVTQAALENIKMMSLQPVEEESRNKSVASGAPNEISHKTPETKEEMMPVITDITVDLDNPDYGKHSNTSSQSSCEEMKEGGYLVKSAFLDKNDNNKLSRDLKTSLFYVPNAKCNDPIDTGIIDLEASSRENSDLADVRESKNGSQISTIYISKDNIEEFAMYQEEVITEKVKNAAQKSRHKSIAMQMKKKRLDSQCSEEDAAQSNNWKVLPNDILGFLLPAYSFLMNHEEAVKIMADCDAFQTVVNFLEESTSQTLEGKSSSIPESTTVNALEMIHLLFTENSETATTLLCLLDFFEISILSVPNLVNMSNPPPLMCLKMIEVSLAALRFYKKSRKRNSSLHRIKHSRSRFFKSIIEYLMSFYRIKQHRVQGLSLHIAQDHKDVWSVASNFWSGCLEGLCSLVKPMEDLQEMLVKTPILSHFMAFLIRCEPFDVQSLPIEKRKIIESYFDLIHVAAEASNALRGFILHSNGSSIARKFNLMKLEQVLDLHQGKE